MTEGSTKMTSPAKRDSLQAGADTAPSTSGARQPLRRPQSAGAGTKSRTARRARTPYAGLQWMLAVGSIAAVVVGANGLAQQDALAAISEVAITPTAPQVVDVQLLAPVQAQVQQNATTVAVAPVQEQIITLPGLAELPMLNLPPIPTVPVPQIVQLEVRQTLPARPAARSRSSR